MTDQERLNKAIAQKIKLEGQIETAKEKGIDHLMPSLYRMLESTESSILRLSNKL